jgi:hypothetical protein
MTGSVIVNDEGEEEEVEHPFASETTNEYELAHKFVSVSAEPDILTPSIEYGRVPPKIEISCEASQSPKH